MHLPIYQKRCYKEILYMNYLIYYQNLPYIVHTHRLHDDDAGDWYVALGWENKRAVIKMDSEEMVLEKH